VINQQDIHSILETTFLGIQQQRMQGVPVINERLSVKAIGFHEWNKHQLGVLITPWFMNLMLFPQTRNETGDRTHNKVGSTYTHIFPSGAYDFVVGYEEDIGYYQSCSLFSPMFEFEDQQATELTAKEVLAALMNEDNIDYASQSRDHEIEQIWKGEKPAPVITDGFSANGETQNSLTITKTEPTGSQKPLSERVKERIDEPTSRRDFLRGKIFSSDKTVTMDKQA
jgi:[NiFe] hydrogenase assembly HybE family chaperone